VSTFNCVSPTRLGRPGGFEGRGRSLSPQAHGRADHLAGLEGGQELPKEGCLPVHRRSGKDHPPSPPAPRAGPPGPPPSGPRTYFQTTRLTESGTFRVTDFQSSRLCNFRTHVVCQFGGPREASSRQNRLPRRNPGEVQYLKTHPALGLLALHLGAPGGAGGQAPCPQPGPPSRDCGAPAGGRAILSPGVRGVRNVGTPKTSTRAASSGAPVPQGPPSGGRSPPLGPAPPPPRPPS